MSSLLLGALFATTTINTSQASIAERILCVKGVPLFFDKTHPEPKKDSNWEAILSENGSASEELELR